MASTKQNGPRLTSITETAADRFAKTAKDRAMLSCTMNPGLHLVKLARGCSWRYRYTDATGKRRVATIGRYPAMLPKDAAKRVVHLVSNESDPLKERKTAQDRARAEEIAKAGKTLRAYLDGGYAAIMATWPYESAKLDRGRIIQHFGDLLDRPMDEITRHDMRAWQARCDGIAYTTVKRAYTSLKALLRQAVRDEVIAADPLSGFKLLPPSREEQERILSDPGKAKRRKLSTDEIKRLHAGLDAFAEELREGRRNSRKHGKPELPDLDAVAFPHWFIPFTHLAFHSGLRVGDLLSLTWEEINPRFGKLKKITSKSSTRALRTGGKPAVVEMKLNDRIAEIMREWWQQQGEPLHGLVFPSPKTGRQLDRKAHDKPWKRVKTLAGLDPDLNFYALRHHFISSLVAQGVPLLTVAKLAGHKKVSMIEEHYGHLCPDQAAIAVDVFAKQVTFSERMEARES